MEQLSFFSQHLKFRKVRRLKKSKISGTDLKSFCKKNCSPNWETPRFWKYLNAIMTVLNFDWNNNNNRSGLHKDTDKISLLQLPACLTTWAF